VSRCVWVEVMDHPLVLILSDEWNHNGKPTYTLCGTVISCESSDFACSAGDMCLRGGYHVSPPTLDRLY